MILNFLRRAALALCLGGSMLSASAQDLIARQAPVDRRLRAVDSVAIQRAVERDMLSPDEVEQINAYHMVVSRRLMPLLTDAADTIWLARATASIEDDRG